MIAWSRHRPRFRGLVAAFDHLDVMIDVAGHERLSPADRRAFVNAFPYHPQITWWFDGQRIRY